MTHRTKVLIRSMSRRVKIAHLLIAKVASQKTLRRWWKEKTRETQYCYNYEDFTAWKEKQFFSLFAVYSTEIWYFSQEGVILKIGLLGIEAPLDWLLCSRHKLHPGTVIQSSEDSLSSSFQFISHCCFLALLGTAIEASDTLEHQPTVWPVPNACAQPYHPGSGSHGQPFRLC